MSKPVLGRGLGALLSGATPRPGAAPANGVEDTPTPQESPAPGDRVRRVALDRIRPSPFQPRQHFPAEALQELADSIREQGVIQPLIVRERADYFELIAGERRWRASQLAGLEEVPIIVREADDSVALELALIENLQREDLNPIEEALGYHQLLDQFQLRQEDVAAKVGKSRATVANALRLLKLPAEIQAHVRDGRLSSGHAKAILALPTADDQLLAAARILRGSLNVRQAESLTANWQNPAAATSRPPGAAAAPASRDAHIADLEQRLQERLGTRVHLRYRQGKGSLDIRFFNDSDLERILQMLGVHTD